MALRLVLVAMVVAMSLPIPNANNCNLLLQELKREINATLGSLQNEWPGVEHTTQPAQVPAALTDASDVETEQPQAEPNPARLESPLELAFSVIVEEFARDAADHMHVSKAQEHLAVIPMPDMPTPLPPAPDASELVAHQQTLSLIDTPVLVVHRLEGPIEAWEWESLCPIQPEVDQLPRMNEPSHVTSTEMGPWADLITQISTPAEFESATAEQTTARIETEMSAPEHWLKLAEMAQMESTSPAPLQQPQHQRPVVISKALKLTVEALAAWTQVVVRPY